MVRHNFKYQLYLGFVTQAACHRMLQLHEMVDIQEFHNILLELSPLHQHLYLFNNIYIQGHKH